MFKRFAITAAVLLLAGCASSRQNTFTGEFERPAAASRVLVMTPDVQLSLLGAAGMPEPREDWSQAARDHLARGVASYIQSKSHSTSALDPTTAMDGRSGQIIRLHDAVGTSILAVNYMNANVPTRRGNFEWTLGEGVRELASTHSADYALFITTRGSYASAGRVAAMIGLAVLGVGVPLGGQQAFASLVDLRTGNIVWFNVATVSPNWDIREPQGAQEFANYLLREAPL